MNYEQAMEFLRGRTKFGINLGLERITALLAALDNPHRGQVKYIHIGGTNGKGSTGMMLQAIATAAGNKCGFFSSPHLHSYCERIRINGEPIAEPTVAALISNLEPLLDQLAAQHIEAPTEFELNTAMALQHFTAVGCDYAVLEVGMGGSIDSTNVIMPALSLITNVGLDHMDYLGDTVEKIAEVKAGIIKPYIPLVCGSREASVIEVISQTAAAQHAPLLLLNRDFCVTESSRTAHGQSLTVQVGAQKYENLQIPLLGAHQLDNAACAVAAAHQLGFSEQAIRAGLAQAFWAGRLERISELPLIVLDGAHNEQGMQALAAAIRDYWADKRIIAVLGMLADKQREDSLAHLLPYLSSAVVTRVDNARAGNWQQVGEIVRTAGVRCCCVEDTRQAVDTALAMLAHGEGDMLLIAGSLYMLSDARAHLVQILPKKPLILASASPRRSQMLSEAGIPFELITADIEELEQGLPPQELVTANARDKAQAVAAQHPARRILAADTVVAIDGEILGKPHDAADACAMLKKLSGRSHSVFTGFTLISEQGECRTECEQTQVFFRELSEQEIAAYVATGEPLDKAGAYGIQGSGANLVASIIGDYQNVVGLPLQRVKQIAAQLLLPSL